MVEPSIDNREVFGSSPRGGTSPKLVKTRIKAQATSLSSSMAGLLIVNQEVPGSNPGGGAKGRLPSTVMGWLAEPRRPKGHAGSNPASSVVS